MDSSAHCNAHSKTYMNTRGTDTGTDMLWLLTLVIACDTSLCTWSRLCPLGRKFDNVDLSVNDYTRDTTNCLVTS